MFVTPSHCTIVIASLAYISHDIYFVHDIYSDMELKTKEIALNSNYVNVNAYVIHFKRKIFTLVE